MSWTRSMTRTQIHDDDASLSSRKGPKTCSLWSDLDHDLIQLVMMQLGVVEYYSFRGVCKSWRSFACINENMVMASIPPMSISIPTDANEKECCYLEDFEGRKFKTILRHSVVGRCVGFTCGYLVFFTLPTREFLLVNPITMKEFHFHDSPFGYSRVVFACRVILVYSTSISEWVLVVKPNFSTATYFSVAGKGAWNDSCHNDNIHDLCAFKGKIYVLTNKTTPYHLWELRFTPQPKLISLEITKPDSFFPTDFVSSGEKLYALDLCSKVLNRFQELDLGEMKWVPCDCEEKIEEYAFFCSISNHVGVVVKRESWADPRSRSHGSYASFPNTGDCGKIKFITAKIWYFPHESMNGDRIDE